MTKPKIVIYCDGSCLNNPGPGGYAALIMLDQKPSTEKVVAGNNPSTTNNRMELTAAIEGLKALKKKCQVSMYCDSQYVIKGITEWRFSWQKKGFKNIANKDLWQELIDVSAGHDIDWIWVKAHNGNVYNERVDEIARQQACMVM